MKTRIGTSPLVSVVMPTYNRANLLQGSVSSVLNQTLQDLELVIVDDRSTDDTKTVIESMNDPRIVYVWNEGRKGPSGARNSGIARARGHLISLVDSDDQWNHRKLELQLEVLNNNPDVDAVGCGWRWLNKRTGKTRIVRIPKETGRIDGLPRWAFNTCPEQLIRRRAIEAILFDEDLWTYECMEWVVRLSQVSRSAYISDVLVDCYDHDGVRASDGHLRCLDGLDRVMSKHEDFIRGDRSAWSGLNLKLGAGLLIAGGDRRKARRHLVRSLHAQPTAMRAWAYAVASTVPLGGSAISALRNRVTSSSPSTHGM